MVGFPDYERGGVLFVLLLMMFLASWAATSTAAAQSAPDCSTVTYNGSGTTMNPYEVENVDQLQCIESQGLSANYAQVSDIDASGTSSWNRTKGFDPVGEFPSVGTPFTGNFDGRGYDITNLTIIRSSEYHVGMFGVVLDEGTVTNASVAEADINGFDSVGGLVGVNFYGTVSDSHVTGTVTGARGVGGLVGRNYGEVSDSHTVGTVNGTRDVGGLVGKSIVGVINRSCVSGSVKGSSIGEGLVNGMGGLVGSNSISATVSESCASGSVDGRGNVGGLVAFNEGTVEESYSTASVNGGSDFMGGLVGLHAVGTISGSYATGSINGSHRFVGGLVGNTVGSGTVSDSYWDTQTTGQSSSAQGIGLTTSEMTGSAATSNMEFDFTSTWGTTREGYPVLSWQTDSGN